MKRPVLVFLNLRVVFTFAVETFAADATAING